MNNPNDTVINRPMDMILYFIIVYSLISCTSLDKEEYEVLNTVIGVKVYPRTDLNLATKIMEEKDIRFSRAIIIAHDEMSYNKYTFTISDTLYPVDLPKDTWENLHYKFVFNEIKDRSDKPLLIDFAKIKFKENLKRIPVATSDSNYIGHFKFHRVLFDKSKKRAYVRVETPEYSGFLGILLSKEKGKWKIE